MLGLLCSHLSKFGEGSLWAAPGCCCWSASPMVQVEPARSAADSRLGAAALLRGILASLWKQQSCGFQGCWYRSVSGSALIWHPGSGSGSRRAKMTHKNRKKYRIFMFWSAGCSLLRAEGFSCSLGVLYDNCIKSMRIRNPGGSDPDPAVLLMADPDPVPNAWFWWPKIEKILQLKKLHIFW